MNSKDDVLLDQAVAAFVAMPAIAPDPTFAQQMLDAAKEVREGEANDDEERRGQAYQGQSA